VWTACDFSEGEIEDAVFAIRFVNSDNAGKFKEAYEGAQVEMKAVIAGDDAGDTSKGDEAADALASLSTKEEAAE
jgi:Ran-binding protein 1